jgi:hypothetical protein
MSQGYRTTVMNIDIPHDLRDNIRAYEAATQTMRAMVWSRALASVTFSVCTTVVVVFIVATW